MVDHRFSTLTRWALAATFLLPIACSSAPKSSSSGFASTSNHGSLGSGSGSGRDNNGDNNGGDGYEVDSGTAPTLGEDSGTNVVVDAGTSTADAEPTADTSPPAATFAGTFNCNLTFTYNLQSPISSSGSEPATGILTTTESGTVVMASLSGDAGISCALQFADQGGGMASLSPPSSQLCDVNVMGTPIEIDFTSGGTATLALPSLTTTIPFSMQDGPGGDLGIGGTGTLTASCTQM